MPHQPVERSTPTTLRLGSEHCRAFAGCNYLGLAHHAAVRDAVRKTLGEVGLSSGASRETSGNHQVHERLEQSLAEFLGVEEVLLLPDGYLANLALLQGLADRVELVLADADAHPSLFDAARRAGKDLLDYGPGDLQRAGALLERHGSRGLAVLTDGCFPLHGRVAPCAELLALSPEHATLVIDDSHGLGVLGERGGGSLELTGIADPRVVLTFSLGKALGAAGGAIAGAATVISAVRRRSDVYVASTPIPPVLAAAAVAALDVLQAEPERVERLRANSAHLYQIGRRLGLESGHPLLPVLAIPVQDASAGQATHDGLRERGLFVPLLRYPGGPQGALLRAGITSEHTAADLSRLERALEEVL